MKVYNKKELSKLTKKELTSIAKDYVNGYSRMNKAELVDVVNDNILNTYISLLTIIRQISTEKELANTGYHVIGSCMTYHGFLVVFGGLDNDKRYTSVSVYITTYRRDVILGHYKLETSEV